LLGHEELMPLTDEFLESSTNLRKNPYFTKPQDEEDSSDNNDNLFPSMEINLQAKESDADLRKLIDEMNNQPSTSTAQSCSSFSSFHYDSQNISFVLPEHLRLMSRCLLAQKSIFEFYKGNSYALNQLNSHQKQAETQIMSMYFS
jgi:hypothetical protein